MAQNNNQIKITDANAQEWMAANQDAIITVTGELGYCKYLNKLLDGEDLKKDIERQRTIMKRKQPNRDPRYTFQLNNAKVQLAVDKQPNICEVIINQRRYQSKDQEGKTITVEHGAKRGFVFGVRQSNGRIKQVKIDADKSLQSGQKVSVQYGIFAYNDGEDFSIGADAIVFEDGEVKYFVPGNAFAEAYTKRGWDMDDSIDMSSDSAESENENVSTASDWNDDNTSDGFTSAEAESTPFTDDSDAGSAWD